MPTVNETNEPSSATTSGQSVMASLGQRVRSLFRGSKNPVETMRVVQNLSDPSGLENGWYIALDNEPYAGPYKRERDAKGQLTRLKKGYTPAARKV